MVATDRGVVLDFIDCPDRRVARCAAELASAEAGQPGVPRHRRAAPAQLRPAARPAAARPDRGQDRRCGQPDPERDGHHRAVRRAQPARGAARAPAGRPGGEVGRAGHGRPAPRSLAELAAEAAGRSAPPAPQTASQHRPDASTPPASSRAASSSVGTGGANDGSHAPRRPGRCPSPPWSRRRRPGCPGTPATRPGGRGPARPGGRRSRPRQAVNPQYNRPAPPPG